jgi:hypothetical protein
MSNEQKHSASDYEQRRSQVRVLPSAPQKCLQIAEFCNCLPGSIVINTAEGLEEVAFSMPKLKGRDREAPPLYSFECLPLLPEEPAGHEATAHQ